MQGLAWIIIGRKRTEGKLILTNQRLVFFCLSKRDSDGKIDPISVHLAGVSIFYRKSFIHPFRGIVNLHMGNCVELIFVVNERTAWERVFMKQEN